MSRGPRTRWSTRTAAAPSRPGHTYEKHAEPPSHDGRLLRNCALEQLAGFAVEEREAEMGGTLAQAVKDANTVLGIVGGGSGILVHQAILEGAIHQDGQLAGGGRDGFGFPDPVRPSGDRKRRGRYRCGRGSSPPCAGSRRRGWRTVASG